MTSTKEISFGGSGEQLRIENEIWKRNNPDHVPYEPPTMEVRLLQEKIKALTKENEQWKGTLAFLENNGAINWRLYKEKLEEKEKKIVLLEHLLQGERATIEELREELSHWRIETNPDDLYDFC